MSKYSYLLKKWWFWALAILFLVILFYSFWVIIYLVALASLIFGIVKVVKNENRRKYTIILTISAIFLITFSLIRVVQMYNYVINNPEETTANEQKKNTVQDEQTEKPAQEDAAEDEQTEEPAQDDVPTPSTITSDSIELFNESIDRLISDSSGVLIKVVPFENEYDMLIAYVLEDLKYEKSVTKQKIADYLGSEIQQRALGTLFGGDNNQRPMVELRYEDETKMAGSSAFDKTNMKLAGK
ncbi:cytochrome d ubiquinol oxidase subunit II [Listeria monocytogenes]|nr:cytochrome d ubiquinol oxidase subunit II [Listeria monocytogenes]